MLASSLEGVPMSSSLSEKNLFVDVGELDPEGVAADRVRPSGVGRVYDALWSFMCSLPRALMLLAFLAAACVVGMFYDQTLTYEEQVNRIANDFNINVGPIHITSVKARLLTFFELNDVFSSWWFVIIVVYLLISITACSIERFPKIWIDALYPQKNLGDDQLKGIKQSYRTTLRGPQAVAAAKRAVSLFQEIFKTKAPEVNRDGTTYHFYERHRYGRFGVYIIHAGLVMIFSGGILVNFTKIDGMMMVTEGRKARLARLWGPGRMPFSHDIGFEVRCEDFRLKTFIDGAPMEFESDLSVWDPASPVNPVIRKTIQVNDPLEHHGYTFYQASYNPIPGDQLVQLDIGPRGKSRETFTVNIGERVTMPDGTAYIPIETIENYAGLGAAVRVQEVTATGLATNFVVFRSYPDFDRDVRRGAFDVQFRGFDQQYATGLQVGSVPFIPIVFAGFLVMFVGMFMAFFMSHRRYWLRIVPDAAGNLQLVFAGAARRHHYAFEEEFSGLNDLYSTAFGKTESVADRARALAEARRLAEQREG
jgi:cytochrome c biogenesis protein